MGWAADVCLLGGGSSSLSEQLLEGRGKSFKGDSISIWVSSEVGLPPNKCYMTSSQSPDESAFKDCPQIAEPRLMVSETGRFNTTLTILLCPGGSARGLSVWGTVLT